MKIISRYTLVISCYYILALLQVTAKAIQISRSSRCKTFSSDKGTCVNLQKCEYFVNLLRENPNAGRSIIYQSRCSFSIFNLKVCCPESQRNDPQPATTEAPTSHILSPPKCGFSNKVHDRVVGGNPSVPDPSINLQLTYEVQNIFYSLQVDFTASKRLYSNTFIHEISNNFTNISREWNEDITYLLGAWPWIAIIGFGNSLQQISFECGGALISSRHVITAGHCVYDANPRVVRLGEHDFTSNNDKAFDILIEKTTIHPHYNKELEGNDIAILKLNKDVQFTDSVHPICLPVSNEIKNRDLVGYYPFVAGWGALHYDGPASPILREVQVPVVDTEQCKKIYQDFDDVVIDDRVICAGYTRGGKDACQGDSGGPLMFPLNSSYYLIGVVSSGYKCAEPGFPGIYTRVTSFLDFILSHIE